MLKIVGEGSVYQVKVSTGATLTEVLEEAGIGYDENKVYRALGGEIGPDDVVPDEGFIVYASAETNGCGCM